MTLTGPLNFSADRRIVVVDILGDYDEEEIGALFGAAAGVGTVTGETSLVRLLQAAASGLGVTTGQVSATAFLEALAQGLGVVSGMLTQQDVFRGVAAGVGAAAADLTVSRALDGTAAGLGVAAGDLSALAFLQATAAGLGTTASALTVETLLEGAASGVGASIASLSAAALLQALAEGAGVTEGTLTLEDAFVFTFPAEDELANEAILDFDFINDQYQHDGVLYDDLTALAANPAIAWVYSRSTTKNVRSSGSDLPTTSVAANLPARDFLAGSALGIYLERSKQNILINTAAGADLATQTRTVSNATQYTLSFYGTGSITLSGAATGTLNGTGANDRVKLSFTTSGTSLTLTVAGSCKYAQLEAAAYPSSWVSTGGASATRGGDTLTLGPVDVPTGSVPITNGTFDTDLSGWTIGSDGGALLPTWDAGLGGRAKMLGNGTNQIYMEQSFTTVVGQLYRIQFLTIQAVNFLVGSSPGGTDLDSGTTTSTTAYVFNNAYFTATTTTTYLRFTKLGTVAAYIDNVSIKTLNNLLTNGDFISDLSGWTDTSTGTATVTWVDGTANFVGGAAPNQAGLYQQITVVPYRTYKIIFSRTGVGTRTSIGTTTSGTNVYNSTAAFGTAYFVPTVSTLYVNMLTSSSTGGSAFDYVRVVEVVPFEGWTPEGTWILFLRGDDYNASTTTHRFLSVDDATNNNRWPGFWTTVGGSTINLASAGADQYQSSGAGTWSNLRKKVSLAAQSNDARAYVNGTDASAQDTSVTLPGVRQAHIGAGSNNADNCDGWIERLIYFPRRISDGQQANITGVVWP